MLNFNCATWSLFPGHNFQRWAKLTSIFLVLSFHLEQQAWFRVGVVSVDPIIFRCSSPFVWRSRCSIASSWSLSTKIVMIIINILTPSWISIEFMMRNTILALDDLFYHRSFYCFPFNTKLFVFCVIPWVPCYPSFVLLYLEVLPSFMSRMSWESHHLLRILGIVVLLTISILSWSSYWF